MAYSTPTDVRDLISEEELAQLTAQSGPVDEAQVTAAISDADAEMDAYLGAVYTVPVSPVTSILIKISVDIAIYNLFGRRSVMTDVRRQRYEDAIALLKMIAAGKATIGTPVAPAQKPEIESSTRIFSRTTQGVF